MSNQTDNQAPENSVQHISVEQLKDKLSQEELTIVDLRDSESFAQSHIDNAINVDKNDIVNFIDDTDKNQAICVYCYRGISCIAVAEHLLQQGFTQVYSLDGGYDAWDQAARS